jgi:hypothetical protein
VSIRVHSHQQLFAWLKRESVPHAVLRYFDENDDDIDLLVEDEAIPFLITQLGVRRGLKVDLYGVAGVHGDYHGHPHLPKSLGHRILSNPRHRNGLQVPQLQDEYLALLYHLAYHKPSQSGIAFEKPEKTIASKYTAMLHALENECQIPNPPTTLTEIHKELLAADLGITYDRLRRYLQHDFSLHHKTMFHARLMETYPGELNLYVIREVAIRHEMAGALLEALEENFTILTVKNIPWWTRLTTSRHIRGGKWRRGGRPHIAVVVFDSDPTPTNSEEQTAHPFVFNARQFLKQHWRERFHQLSGARSKDNPIHSTDNEAEAIGHLPLFFSDEEIDDIVTQVTALRAAFGRTNVS